jgi:DNA-directed RNA polymerase specialized sigma subunit
MERQDILESLAQRMARLSSVQKKVLAMYYHENMPVPDIATCFGWNALRICQIHIEAVASLRTFFCDVKSRPDKDWLGAPRE